MDKFDPIKALTVPAPEAIIRTLAMMAYNPAIGRVREPNSVSKFADLMMETIPKLYNVLDTKISIYCIRGCAKG